MALGAGALDQASPLQHVIAGIAREARGKVSVACASPGSTLNCNLDAHAHPPMQSVFKLPLAVAVLQQVEQGKLSIDQPVHFGKTDLFVPKGYSPLQDKYPQAEVDVPLRELLRLVVTLSDNAAADLLLRTVGGPAVVDASMESLGVSGFHLEDGEHALSRDESAQYRNWFEPASAVVLLRRLADNPPLTPEHMDLLTGWMRTVRLPRLAGDLPAGTVVAHRTGTSGTENGVTAATNDIGLITLPDGRQLAIAVFVTDSKADDATREQVIARIGRAAYDAATRGR